MGRMPNLLGLEERVIAGIKDYYETTMADTNIVAGINGRNAVFNATIRGLGWNKVVGEDEFTSDGYSAVIDGKIRRLAEFAPDIAGRRFHLETVERDNYFLNMGLEQILGYLSAWQMNDALLEFYAQKGLSQDTIRFLEKNRRLDLTVNAIPEGIPIFGHEPFVSVEGEFEKDQFPESLIIGTHGLQTGVATQASYYLNILEEFGRTDILTLEGGSRRVHPAVALSSSRAALAAGFKGTSLEQIAVEYPELAYAVGGSAGHSAILHIGSDEKAFELQLRAYYRINEGDSQETIRDKIKKTKGIGPTFLIDTFDSNDGLEEAIRAMKRYGIECQMRNDSENTSAKLKYMRMRLEGEELYNARIMISGDLKPWILYNLLKDGVNVNAVLVGTHLVNPKLPGAAYKLAAHQKALSPNEFEFVCKVCRNDAYKGTLPGMLDVYRIIGSDGKADRDVILLRDVDLIGDFMQKSDSGYLKLNQQVMTHGQITYDLPDMIKLIKDSAYHMSLLRAEHKRFRDAVEYPVNVSPTVLRLQAEFGNSK